MVCNNCSFVRHNLHLKNHCDFNQLNLQKRKKHMYRIKKRQLAYCRIAHTHTHTNTRISSNNIMSVYLKRKKKKIKKKILVNKRMRIVIKHG